MAIYSSLPVYKDAYQLMISLYGFTKNMSREYKYTLGERIKNESTDLILLIYQTNRENSQEKRDAINDAKIKVETIRLLVRMCHDLKLCKLRTFVNISEKVDTVSKQITAWSKYIESKLHSEPGT